VVGFGLGFDVGSGPAADGGIVWERDVPLCAEISVCAEISASSLIISKKFASSFPLRIHAWWTVAVMIWSVVQL
jgi:hypothetical protein